jgi:hypothetical protein
MAMLRSTNRRLAGPSQVIGLRCRQSSSACAMCPRRRNGRGTRHLYQLPNYHGGEWHHGEPLVGPFEQPRRSPLEARCYPRRWMAHGQLFSASPEHSGGLPSGLTHALVRYPLTKLDSKRYASEPPASRTSDLPSLGSEGWKNMVSAAVELELVLRDLHHERTVRPDKLLPVECRRIQHSPPTQPDGTEQPVLPSDVPSHWL